MASVEAYSVGTLGSKPAVIDKLKSLSGDGGSIGTTSVSKMSPSELADFLITASGENDIVMISKVGDILNRDGMGGKKYALLMLLTNPQAPKKREYDLVLSNLNLHASIRPESSTIGMPDSSKTETPEEKEAKQNPISTLATATDKYRKHWENSMYGIASTDGVGGAVTSRGYYETDSLSFSANARIVGQPSADRFGDKSQIDVNKVEFTYSPITAESSTGRIILNILAEVGNNPGSAGERDFASNTVSQLLRRLNNVTGKYYAGVGPSLGVQSKDKRIRLDASVTARIDENNLKAFEGTGTASMRLLDLGTVNGKKVLLNLYSKVGSLNGSQTVAGSNKNVTKNSAIVGASIVTKDFIIIDVYGVGGVNNYDKTNNITGTDFKENVVGVGAKASMDVGKIFGKSVGLVMEVYVSKLNKKVYYDSSLNLSNPNGSVFTAGVNFLYQVHQNVFLEAGVNWSSNDQIDVNSSQKITPQEGIQGVFGIKMPIDFSTNEEKKRLE